MDGYNLVHFGDISCFGFQITDVFFPAGNLDNLQEKLQFQYGVSFDLICKYMYKGRDKYNKVNYTFKIQMEEWPENLEISIENSLLFSAGF